MKNACQYIVPVLCIVILDSKCGVRNMKVIFGVIFLLIY